MQIIKRSAYARAGLIGNPSDGYNGKTISILVRQFAATITLYEWDQVEIVMSANDQSRFRSVHDLVHDVRLHGYYGGVRLIKASIKRFVEYCSSVGLPLHDRTFSIRYDTNIPRQVGMAGSSAIITAMMRCLMEFYDVEIPLHLLPSLVLSIERGELGIAAGLQDRVIQAYEGVVYMDFAPDKMRVENGLEFGEYTPLEIPEQNAPNLYLAYKTEVGEPTEITHDNLRHRWNEGEPSVLRAMAQFAKITDEAKLAIEAQNWSRLSQLMDANFDLRRSICKIAPGQLELVERAREVGVSAKFAGSGGAIIGIYPNEETFQNLKRSMAEIGCIVVEPLWRTPS
ncbi:MAG: GHMP kinase [Planctomycetia bacterium]|nr:GHMP kinase [Planctomycetia bacterium]